MVFRDRFGGCPDCGRPLVEGMLRGSTQLACLACAGWWLDPETVATVVGRHALTDAASGDGVSSRRCPGCAMLMHELVVDGVTIDRCREHGCWFDRGELERITALATEPAWVRAMLTAKR